MISFINMALILPHSQMGHFMFSSVYFSLANHFSQVI